MKTLFDRYMSISIIPLDRLGSRSVNVFRYFFSVFDGVGAHERVNRGTCALVSRAHVAHRERVRDAHRCVVRIRGGGAGGPRLP